MQIKNTIILLQFIKEESFNKKYRDKVKLYVKLLNPSNNPSHLVLPELELYENETFKENTKKYLWRTLQCDKFEFIKSKYYDDYENELDGRIIQCSNLCLLNEEIPIDDTWYQIDFLHNEIVLSNQTSNLSFKYKQEKKKTIITSANLLLKNNNSSILIDNLLYLKNLFYYSDIIFNYVPDEFVMSDIISILNAFSWKSLNSSTIRKRFYKFIEKTSIDVYPAVFTRKTKNYDN